MRHFPSFPPALRDVYNETCQVLQKLPKVQLESLSQYRRLGVLPTGFARHTEEMIMQLHRDHAESAFWVLDVSGKIKEEMEIKPADRLYLLKLPTSKLEDAWMAFIREVQALEIEAWVTFWSDSSGVADLHVWDLLNLLQGGSCVYAITPHSQAVCISPEDSERYKLAVLRLHQLAEQNWLGLPVWEVNCG